MNNAYAKSFIEVLKEVDAGKTSATFFANGKTEQAYLINKCSGLKFIFVNASFEAVALKENLTAFGERVLIFPETSKVLTENFKAEDETLLNALTQIEMAASAGENLAVIFTPSSLCGVVPNKNLIKNNFVNLAVDATLEISALKQALINLGFISVTAVSAPGEFSVKGDTATIFDGAANKLYRVSFFGDQIESIKTLNPKTFSAVDKLNNLKISGKKVNINLTEEDLISAKQNFKLASLKGENLENYNALFDKLITSVVAGDTPFFALPLVAGASVRLTDYLKSFNATVVLIDPRKFNESASVILKNNINTFNSLLASGLVTNAHKASFNGEFLNFFKCPNFKYISMQSLLTNNVYFKTETFVTIDAVHRTKTIGLTTPLKTEIIGLINQNFEVNLVVQNEFTKNTVLRDLADYKQKINIFIGDISSTTIFNNIAIFGIKSVGLNSSAAQQKQIINASSFKEGDYVVHSFHGIGRCEGIVKRTVFGVEKDYFALNYQNGSKLFVPCENANMLSKYCGATPRLSIMGGKDFTAQKNKVRASVKELAFNLASLYAARRERKGFKFLPDDDLQAEFEARFSYIETPGQLAAINDVKRDMQSPKIMDRLICGDVGFGKTEVAMRAAFKAVLSGKQVCLLAPTTVLAMQHYKTFKARMDAYDINIVLLCRFVKGAEEKQNIADVASGKANIIIGTHRVLSADVKFFDLGLFIVDEEQRFGTGQKEQIKNIKQNVDTIALSATPIPRTLHLSLINVRDISVINTPPKNRLPVQVYVCEYAPNIVLSAINAEIARGGQTLIVYNNIERVEMFAAELKSKLGDVVVDYGHAKMSPRVLEDKIINVFNGTTQVFVSTTIIENGVDITNANTLIVIDADKFGLSSLYQLKGRVGRSSTQAYAYFFTEGGKVVGEVADKRLNAIMEFSSLGSGIEIARRDLEIRGAGNIFGAEQSGHMDRIGYEEYVKILDEEVKKASGLAPSESVTTTIETDISMFIDYTYAKATEERTQIYKDLSAIETDEELFNYLEFLKNKYGSVPNSVKNIGEICLIKNLANKNLKAEKIVLNKNECSIYINKQNFSLTDEVYKKLNESGFVLVLPKVEKLSLVKLELSKPALTNEKISKLRQIVC